MGTPNLYLGKSALLDDWVCQDEDERRRHLYAIGQTGTGKTTFLKSLFIQDALTGRGATLIDPHGDAARDIANAIPSHRLDDVIYFDPSDPCAALSLNAFDRVPEAFQSLAVSSLLSCFQSQWSDSWGPRLQYILRHCLTVLVTAPPQTNHSLLSITRLLTDDAFRTRALRHLKDPVCQFLEQ